MSDGLRGAQALDIDDVGVRRLLASRYGGECYVSHRKGDDPGALAWAERGLAAYPDEVSLEGAFATSMIMVGEYREARDRLHRLLDDGDLDPALRPLYQNNLAWADLMTADPHLLPEALATSQAAFGILPMQPAVRGTRGFALILSGAIDEGIALCEDAFRAHRDERSRASNACAMSIGASRQGRIGTAERFLTTAIRLSPENDLIDRAAEELRAASAAMPRSAPEPRVDA
jgi:tetratricopeptide (TPR) repeat protein